MSTSAVSAQMQQYLAACSPQDLQAILATIHGVQLSQSSMTPTNIGMQSVQNGKILSKSRIKKSSKATFSVGRASTPRRNLRRAVRAVSQNTRPLNSWMAFRSYYSPLFSSYQQKDISPLMTQLWESDLFKAKWAILAKAYSIIRDKKGKYQAPLDQFLAHTCPYIGIIEPGQYLSLLGWTFVVNNGVRTLSQQHVPNLNSFPQHIQSTIFSVDEIVDHCRKVEYFVDESLLWTDNSATSQSPSLTMTARPSHTQAQQTTRDSHFNSSSTATTTTLHGQAASVSSVPGSSTRSPVTINTRSDADYASNIFFNTPAATGVIPRSSTQVSQTSIQDFGITPQSMLFPTQPNSSTPFPTAALQANNIDGIYSNSGSGWSMIGGINDIGGQQEHSSNIQKSGLSTDNIDTGSIGAELAAQVAWLKQTGDQYPFNEQFAPANTLDLEFDPSDGDNFNAFNMSEFDNGSLWFSSDYFDLGSM